MDGTSSKSPNKEYSTQFSMSGGPPQHPHGRQVPPNTAWNHLQVLYKIKTNSTEISNVFFYQVPNYYPGRQPQHAHMSSDLSMLATHQPTWHTPTTTEPTKGIPHNPLFNLQQMLVSERPYSRHSPGVDLTLTRNGSQNGDIPQTPISLSVRDTKQINSLALGAALDGDRAVELTKGPSPGLTSLVQERQPSPKNQNLRRPAKRMDSIIDRLNTSTNEKIPQSVIVTATSSSHDENSNSSQGTAIASVPTPTPIRDDEVASPISNEDSLDSNKSRRKRKPCKTVKVSKEDDIEPESHICEKLPTVVEPLIIPMEQQSTEQKQQQKQTSIPPVPPEPIQLSKDDKQPPPRRRSSSEPPTSPTSASKSRRKTVSESETIDNIAAMVAASSKEEINQTPEEKIKTAALPPPPPSSSSSTTTTPSSPTPPAPLPSTTTPPPVTSIISDSSVVEETPSNKEPTPENSQIEKENIPNTIAKPVSVIIRDHSNCSNDSLANEVGNIAEPSLAPPNQPQQQTQKEKNSSETSAAPQMLTLAQKKGDTQCFVAVEDELEKMFAGIADSESEFQPDSDPLAIASTSTSNHNLNESVSSTSNEIAASGGKLSYKRGRPKSTKAGSRRPSDSNSTESTPRKKHKGNKKRDDFDESLIKSKLSLNSKSKKNKKGGFGKGHVNSKVDVVKDIYSYDSGSNASSSRSKGPFIQIKGPRDSPISVNIVNTPCNEDDPDKPSKQFKNKKFHDDSEYRHKVRSKGLHCSTLSNKYDAQTRDATWICVFCKRGPHATDPLLPGPSPFTLDMPQYSPGDLFGPYIISTDCPEYQRRLDDPFDTQYKSKKSALTAAAITGLTPTDSKTSSHGKKAKKRLNSESSVRDSLDGADLGKDVMLGIAEVTPTSFEVWVHEDCVIWSPGVYLVGPKIIGLEGAVWGACAVACKRCGLKGAAICCIKRGCGCVMHIGCAKLSNWKLDEDNYKAYCTAHIVP